MRENPTFQEKVYYLKIPSYQFQHPPRRPFIRIYPICQPCPQNSANHFRALFP